MNRRQFLAATGSGFALPVLNQPEKSIPWTDSEIEQQWLFTASDGFRTSPTIVDDTIYIATREELYALDAETGDENWRFNQIEGCVGSPSVADSVVFIGDNNAVYAIDGTTGEEQWRFEPRYSVCRSVTVLHGTIFAISETTRTTHEGLNSPQNSIIYAIDAENGTTQWESSYSDAIISPPTLAQGTLFVGGGGSVYAINPSNGDEHWEADVEYFDVSAPTVDGDTVYVGANENRIETNDDGAVYALDIVDGSEKWAESFRIGRANLIRCRRPTAIPGAVFVLTGFYDTDMSWSVTAFDPVTGDRIGGFAGHRGARPIIADNQLITSTGESLKAIDLNTEESLWEFEIDSSFSGRPMQVNGTLFVTAGSDLYAIDAESEQSSTDSRTILGTNGHHDGWVHSDQSVDVVTNPGPARIAEDSDRSTMYTTLSDDDDALGPGFGVGGALAGIGGAGYLLKRRMKTDDRE